VLIPVQYSAASHRPIDGRQSVVGDARLWEQVPAAQKSMVQGCLSSQSASVVQEPAAALPLQT
jgi:hypothetical protein